MIKARTFTGHNDNVMRLLIHKPANFNWSAGQYVFLTIQGEKRAFSIANTAHDDFLEFHIRLTNSPFSAIMRRLSDDAEIAIDGPYGDAILNTQYNSDPLLLIVGGTGITHALSILRAHSNRPTTLIASIKEQSDAYFTSMLDEFIGTDIIIHTGLVTEAIERYNPSVDNHCIYIAGPDNMAQAVAQMVVAKGGDPARIYSDSDLKLDK